LRLIPELQQEFRQALRDHEKHLSWMDTVSEYEEESEEHSEYEVKPSWKDPEPLSKREKLN
jgi:hypothetical protein